MDFKNIDELYKRVSPALKTRAVEFNKESKVKIKEEDIFEYLSLNKWKKASDLTLYTIVDDILKCDLKELKEHLRKK